MTRSLLTVLVAAVLAIGPGLQSLSFEKVSMAGPVKKSKRRSATEPAQITVSRALKTSVASSRRLKGARTKAGLFARISRSDATARGVDPFTRPGRRTASNRESRIRAAAKHLRKVRRYGKKKTERQLAAIEAFESELDAKLTYEEKRATIAATVESWLAPALQAGVEIRAVAEVDQDAHDPRHSILGEGNWRVRVYRLLPKTANPLSLAHHFLARAFDSKNNARYLVGLSEDGHVPYLVGPPEGMGLVSRLARTLNRLVPARELFYNTISTERGRWSLAGIAMSFGTLTLDWMGVGGFSFEDAGGAVSALKTIGAIGIGGAIVNGYKLRNKAMNQALADTFAWVGKKNTAAEPTFPGFQTVYGFYEKRSKEISPGTQPLSRSNFQRYARLAELPRRSNKGPRSELRASLTALKAGIKAGAKNAKFLRKAFQEQLDRTVLRAEKGKFAANLIRKQLVEHLPDGSQVEVSLVKQNDTAHPRHSVLADALFRVRAKRVSDVKASFFSKAINNWKSAFDSRLNTEFLVQVSRGSAFVVGGARSTTLLSRSRRLFEKYFPLREMAHQTVNTDLGKVALGAVVLGGVTSLVQLFGGERVSLLQGDESIADLTKWFAAGGVFTTYIQAHFFRAEVKAEALRGVLQRVRERGAKGSFLGIDLVLGDVEKSTEELSPWSRPIDVFELQEKLRVATDLPLRPKKITTR